MALWDDPAFFISTDGLNEELFNPVSRPNQTHILFNYGTGDQIWTAPGGGGTPFFEDGVAVASITVPPGATKGVHSDGVHWVVTSDSTPGGGSVGQRRIFSADGVTNAAGNVTFNFVPPFATPPIVATAIGPAGVTADATEARITALTASSVTINVRRSPAVVLLGISVLQTPVNDVGAQVHVIAVEEAAV